MDFFVFNYSWSVKRTLSVAEKFATIKRIQKALFLVTLFYFFLKLEKQFNLPVLFFLDTF
jgi:hypothetical protein